MYTINVSCLNYILSFKCLLFEVNNGVSEEIKFVIIDINDEFIYLFPNFVMNRITL